MRIILLGTAALALVGCKGNVNWSSDQNEADNAVEIHMSEGEGRDRVAFKLPMLDASVSLPTLGLGDGIDLDGMKLAPDTRVRSMDVTGHDEGGQVRIAFSNPKPPAALIAYYRDAADAAGYRNIRAGTASVQARKDDSDFTLTLRPEGAGSGGLIVIKDTQ
jgi:hypothetical protein